MFNKEQCSTVTFDHCNPLNEPLKVKLGWAPSPEADTEDFSSPKGREDGHYLIQQQNLGSVSTVLMLHLMFWSHLLGTHSSQCRCR